MAEIRAKLPAAGGFHGQQELRCPDAVDAQVILSSLGDQDHLDLDRGKTRTTVGVIAQQDLAGILKFVNRMVEQGTDLHQFTLDLLGHLRALLVAATVEEAGDILHLPDADLARLREQARLFEVDDLDRGFALLSASEYRIKQSEVPRYQLEMVLSRLTRMPRLEPIEELISHLRSGSGGGGAAGGSGPRRSRGQSAGNDGVSAAPLPRQTSPPPTSSSGHETSPPSRHETSPSTAVGGGNGAEPAAADSPLESTAIGGDVGMIIEHLRREKPLIAKIIERADATELRDDTLFLTFERAGGIFETRLSDRSALGAVEEAAEAALGRKIKVVAGVDAGAGSAPAPVPSAQGSDPEGPARRQRDELWNRAERDPMVQHFVEALRGNLTDVEEI